MEKNVIPKTDQTIASLRAGRLEQRLREKRLAAFTSAAWWQNALVEVLGVTALVGLNLYLLYPMLARATVNNPFSGPGIPFLAQIVVFLTGDTFYTGVLIVKTTFFLFFPATFYFLVRYLTGRRLAAILAVLIVLLPQYFFAKSRIVSGYLGGDCPHIASLTMLPLAIYGLISFLRKGSFSNLVTAAATGLTIILISPFGFLAYVVFAFLTTFSEMLLSSGRIKFLRYGLTLAVIVALSSFWYNPAFVFWMISGPFGNDLRLTVSHLLPISIFTVPILGTLGFLLFDRKPNLQPLFLASFWTLTFLAIFFFSRSNFLSATASRSLPELGISLAFLFGATVSVLIDRLKKPIFRNSLTIFITVALVLWIIFARESPVLSGKEVSNYWANESSVVEKGKLWLARDKFDGWSGMVGYVITGTTLITIGLVFLKAKRKVGE